MVWQSKSAQPSLKLPSFCRVRCKHLSTTPVKPLQPGLSSFPIFLSCHHCFRHPHTPAPLHSAQNLKEPLSHFSLWYMFFSNKNLHLHVLSKIPLLSQNPAQMFSFVERHPWAAPSPHHFITNSPICHHLIKTNPLCIYFVPGTILRRVFIN